ncbi:MAG: prephenate dehydrogenase/arogenate dehydrogenase family protein [Acidimicrobiia bacterium]
MHVGIIGTGLIGGSIASGLVEHHEVSCFDPNEERAAQVQAQLPKVRVASTLADTFSRCDLVVIASPVGEIASIARLILETTNAVVTDVGSVKGPVLRELDSCSVELRRRFVGGHPMAGSEQDGLAGADSQLFEGAIWITTPTHDTSPRALQLVQEMIQDLGAQQVVLDAAEHDALVAVISHLPQLVASSLMALAADHSQHAALARLAAGGFRDMTRIAASHPAIWPDICISNREAILRALDGFSDRIDRVRSLVDNGDRTGLLELLEGSRAARRSLPVGAELAGPLSELRIPIPDRPGVLAEITAAASALGVNISDIETTHSPEGDRGVLVLVVRSVEAPILEARLAESGYRASTQHVGPQSPTEERGRS